MLNNYVPKSLFHINGFLIVARKLEPDSVAAPIVVSDVRAATTDDLDLLSQCGHPPLVLNQWFEQGAEAWFIEQEGQLVLGGLSSPAI